VTRYQFNRTTQFSTTAFQTVTSVLQGSITVKSVPTVLYFWSNVQFQNTAIDNGFQVDIILNWSGANTAAGAIAQAPVPLTVANVLFPQFLSGSTDITTTGVYTIDLTGASNAVGIWGTDNPGGVVGQIFVHCLLAGHA